MKSLRSPPTRSALLALRRQLAFLRQGHDMLERKRELLTRLVHDRLAHYRALRQEARAALQDAYRWLSISHLRMGSQMLRQSALGLGPAVEVQILPRSSVGVEYPAVTAHRLPLAPVGLMWTDASFDEARARLADLAVLLARLGEAETALWRLLAEQRKTRKRVNALRYNVIPAYERTVQRIAAALEEEERNALFQLKRLRERQAREIGPECGRKAIETD